MHSIDPDTTAPTDNLPEQADTPPAAESDADGMLRAIAESPDAPVAFEDPVDTTAEPAKVEAVDPVAAKPEEAETDAGKDDEAEIANLNLKDKAAQRFRDMAGEIREFAPVREALKAAGIEDVAQLPRVIARVKDADNIIGLVTETGATGKQFGETLDYLAMVNAAERGDLKAAGQAYAVVEKELAALAAILGKSVTGVHDPLVAHADLKQKVEEGEMTRAAAEELAGYRVRDAVQKRSGAERDRENATRRKNEEAVGAARTSLNDLGARLAAADPDFPSKVGALKAARDQIVAKYPPDQWAERLELHYFRTMQPKPAAALKPPMGPMRPSGPRMALAPTTDDPYEAMRQGIAAASAG